MSRVDADSARRIIKQMEAAGADLTDDQRGDIEIWNKGRALAQLTAFYGWEVALEMLQSYVTDAIQRALSTDPKDVDEVRAAHAVAFTANRIYTTFLSDVNNAIQNSRQMPESFRNRNHATPVPPESM